MKTKYLLPLTAAGAGLFLLNSCKSFIPKNVESVKNFDAGKYLGKWYEIARMTEFFERGLTKTTANYSQNPDGSIKVVNRGYSERKHRWKQAEGVAKFVKDKNTAELKVSFFRPFWAGYNVIAIDEEYRYALVAGESYRHLWILSRTPEIPENIKTRYLQQAQAAGYDVSKLIWTEQ